METPTWRTNTDNIWENCIIFTLFLPFLCKNDAQKNSTQKWMSQKHRTKSMLENWRTFFNVKKMLCKKDKIFGKIA